MPPRREREHGVWPRASETQSPAPARPERTDAYFLKATIAVVIALGVLLAVVAAGARSPKASGPPSQPCGVEIVDGTGPDASVGYSPCPGDEPPGPPEPQIVVPRSGMDNVRARPFDTATVGDDGRTVTIDFVSGIEPCTVLDHVKVRYGSKIVTLTLFEGNDPSAGDVACIEIGVFKRVIITLDEPLGDRTIVDGAAI
ncbi:MAG TPA: hypothetical protein VGR41_06730 [Actinomycetota bacterium]|nr:hypothetical protein [Actinomycetota bacterium]